MNHSLRLLLTSTALALLGIMPATAQQITGTPGAPSATTTIDGNYIPNPPPAFGGEINLNAKDSKTWWPPNIVPPKGAPNILLIMTADQGYGISGTFGGRHSDAHHGPHRENGTALHEVSFDLTLFTLAGGDHHRA